MPEKQRNFRLKGSYFLRDFPGRSPVENGFFLLFDSGRNRFKNVRGVSGSSGQSGGKTGEYHRYYRALAGKVVQPGQSFSIGLVMPPPAVEVEFLIDVNG